MRNRIFIGVILLCAVICINSCESKEALMPVSSGNGGGGSGGSKWPAGCDSTNLTYSGGIDSIINTQCAVAGGCHLPKSGTAAANFNSYAGVTAYTSGGASSMFYQRLEGKGGALMPSSAQPGWDPCMKLRLEQWVINGAPQ
jgi:hypothetical protein